MNMKKVSEEKCWFVIGAHQAGASERQCSELSGLSKTITHNIIRNFKKLGSPHANKLSVNSLLNKNNLNSTSKKGKVTKIFPRKIGRPCNPVEKPFFTQSIVRKALSQARKIQDVDQPNLNFPLDRPDTPPFDEDKLQTDLKIGQTEELPLTPHTIIDDPSEDESWSVEEDKELLKHVLNLPLVHIKWKEVERNFNDRHLAKMCSDRWDYIKKQLLKDVEETNNLFIES